MRSFVFTGLMVLALGVDAANPDDSDSSLKPGTSQSKPVTQEQVVVTGSRLPAAAAQTAQDVHIYGRERIENSGRTTLADFLATVPEASINSVESTFGATSVRLRGAREGSTLILINGRRTQAVTGSASLIGFFDLNTIPLSMVERIEVLPTGSSAIYGGEALAGVVNIVLRSDFSGADVTIGYKSAKNTDEKLAYGGAGWKGDFARASVMMSYSKRSSLSGADRDLTANSDLRRFGGPNLASPFFGVPATIFSVSGNLPGLNSSFAAVPRGSPGVGLQPSSFATTAGTQNFGSFNAYQDILQNSERTGFFASGEYRLRNGIDLFGEVLASEFRNNGRTTPPALLQTTVPATNAFNPFGTAVRAAGFIHGTEALATFDFHDQYFRPLVGARGDLASWHWEATALYSKDHGGQVIHGQPNAAAVTAALASSDPATALNPFVDGPMGSPALLATIFNQLNISDWNSDATILNAFARGPIVRLPAGTLDAVIGAEHERSGLARGIDIHRSASAVFSELRAPLMAAIGDDGATRELLALQGAARHDNYSDFGGESTWQAGIEIRPAMTVLLRATSGTAFKPPTLFNLGAPFSSSALPVTDPRRGGESVVMQSTTGGNPNLQPTTGKSSTVGGAWSPRVLGGFNLTATWWTLRIDNAIILPNAQFIINNESAYPGRVVRAPSSNGEVGQIVSADRSYINFGSMREEGFDASADWTLKSGVGTFTPALAATYMTKFKGASAPGAADVDRLSRANSDGIFAPRVKATASVGWTPNAAVRMSLLGRYVGRYLDYTPTRTLGDFWYLDGGFDVAIEPALHLRKGALGGLKLLVSGTNLANKQPPYSTHFRGYDIYNYDIIGRTILVRLQAQL